MLRFSSKKLLKSLQPLFPICQELNYSVSITRKQDGIDINDGNSNISLCHIQSRENCECCDCMLHPSRQRQIMNVNTNKIFDIEIVSAFYDDKSKQIHLKWTDNHDGFISVDRIFNEKQIINNNEFNNKIKLWKNSPSKIYYNFNEIMQNDCILLNMYKTLDEYGIVHIYNSLNSYDTIKDLGKRICHTLLPTVYGESALIEYDPNAFNAAFTNYTLSLHTDMPYYKDTPNYLVFHCIDNDNDGGGCSLYADGWNIINEMKINHYHHYNTLKSTLIPYRDHQISKWDLSATKYVIDVDVDGIYSIHCNEYVRDSLHWNASNDEKLKWYQAFKIFTSYTESDEFHCKWLKKKGEISIFNNRRILHSREAFNGNRTIKLSYFQQSNMNAVRHQLQSYTNK